MNNTSNNNYAQKIKIKANANQVFRALNNGLNLWWSSISDAKFETNGHFTVTFENNYWWTFKITEYIPNKKLTWKCTDGEPDFNKEWIGHELHWHLEKKEPHTIVKFQQIGLTPKLHCYSVCASTWDMFITKKLKDYLEN